MIFCLGQEKKTVIQYQHLIPSVKHGGGSIMVCVCCHLCQDSLSSCAEQLIPNCTRGKCLSMKRISIEKGSPKGSHGFSLTHM